MLGEVAPPRIDITQLPPEAAALIARLQQQIQAQAREIAWRDAKLEKVNFELNTDAPASEQVAQVLDAIASGALAPELWVIPEGGTPVSLGQIGHAGEAELEAVWRARLAHAKGVHAVLPLDAFSRCWVQEGVLWQAVAPLLPSAQQAAFARLKAAWQARQLTRCKTSMAELAQRLALATLDVQTVESDGWRGAARGIGFSKLISTSNEVDLELSDFVEYLNGGFRYNLVSCTLSGTQS